MKAVTTAVMRSMDECAIHRYGIPSVVLMEHAAIGMCNYLKKRLGKQQHILILCGPGNNGGDGFALARLLLEEGFRYVSIHCSVDYAKMSKDEAVFAKIAESLGITIHREEAMTVIKELLTEADIVIDALFGTGLSRPISGFYDQLILQLNLLQKKVISVDIASGIHGDTGEIMGCAVQASVTLTFEQYKLGQILYPGSAYSGTLIPISISMPSKLVREVDGLTILDDTLVKELLPKRMAHSHKGTYGKALMVGGSKSMHGAVTMAAKAALRSGIGTLTLFVPDCIALMLANKLEEAMLVGASSDHGFFAKEAIIELKRILLDFDLIIIGNGMGRNEISRALVAAVLESDRPCILDGDALYEAGKLKEGLARSAQTILTPHVKEMSYLSGYSCKDIQKDPVTILKDYLNRYPHVTLALKDAYTIIANKDTMYLNLAGNHALAKGGSGDVLCGILAGLYGQSREALAATACAVYVHARTADLLIQEQDAYSILPNDLIQALSDTYQYLALKKIETK